MTTSMQTQVLDGIKLARKIREQLTGKIADIQANGGVLALATVQVGHSKDAEAYAKSLDNFLTKLGLKHFLRAFPEKVSADELIRHIHALNNDPEVTGIMVLSPLPKHLDPVLITNAIALGKDVEGRRVLHGMGDRVISPTALSVLTLIEDTGVDIAGKEAVVVGHSDVVGKPITILLLDKMATVTTCHAKTRNLKEHVERAEVLVSAAGKPHLIKAEWIRHGAIVIDVGENVVDGKIVGDVEFEAAKKRASFISPVPGGVGPVTNMMMIKNLLVLYRLKAQKENGDR